MIFEYLPTSSFSQDIKNISYICRVLPVTDILIPTNPLSRPYPQSLLVASKLQDYFLKKKYKLGFIPTIKTNLYVRESLISVFLSLEYSQIKKVAIISGDRQENKGLSTYEALNILAEIREQKAFLQNLELFCALESVLSSSNIISFCKKIQLGVCNFITQPFYVAHNSFIAKLQSASSYRFDFLNLQVSANLPFMVFRDYLYNRIQTMHLAKSVRIFCGFFPLFSAQQASCIHAKKLGILIPNRYINNLNDNPYKTNLDLLLALCDYDVSIGYMNFTDMKKFLMYYREHK